MICERLLKEREEKVREEYEETMTSKLAGWYTRKKDIYCDSEHSSQVSFIYIALNKNTFMYNTTCP